LEFGELFDLELVVAGQNGGSLLGAAVPAQCG
jgi:hypothetical protein